MIMINKKFADNPTDRLRKAIEILEAFTQKEDARLALSDDGMLVPAKESILERIGILSSSQKRLQDIKQVIIQSRDVVQKHVHLIETTQMGDRFFRVIQRFNHVVADETSAKADNERRLLLEDSEIKGKQIKVPHAISVKYEKRPETFSTQKMFKELSDFFQKGIVKKEYSAKTPTHMKSHRFMIDTFQMKSIRMIGKYLKKTPSEIVALIKQSTPLIQEDEDQERISIQQEIEVDKDSNIFISGSFKKNPLVSMPILDIESLRLVFFTKHL